VRCGTPGRGPCCTHIPMGVLIPTRGTCGWSTGGTPCAGWVLQPGPHQAWGDGVLCRQGTLWGGDRTGRGGQASGADPPPGSPWGLVPVRGPSLQPPWVQGCGRGCLGHPAVAAVAGHPSAPSRSHSFVKAVFLRALAACPAAAPAPPALCVPAFWQRGGFFHPSHSQMAAESPPRFAPRSLLGSRGRCAGWLGTAASSASGLCAVPAAGGLMAGW